MNQTTLWFRLPNFQCDIDQLKSYLRSLQKSQPVTKESLRGKIFGWPITSVEDSSTVGIKRISLRSKIRNQDLIHPTNFCTGYIKDVLVQIAEHGIVFSRARILALAPGAEMPFHDDQLMGTQQVVWRLHIPIQTNTGAELQWKQGKLRSSVHLPADGSAYMINATEIHRAVNTSKSQTRYHFVASVISHKIRGII